MTVKHPKRGQKWYQNGTEMIPKWSQSDPKKGPKMPGTDKKIFFLSLLQINFLIDFFSLLDPPPPPKNEKKVKNSQKNR